jgi:acyl-CoA reductase-like NAD-dependent aldehyde dehydrogenase
MKAMPDARTFDVVNPATGEVVAHAPDCSRSDVDEAFLTATGAFAGWAADEPARCRAMRAAADAVEAAGERIAPVLTTEQGKPLAQALAEVRGAAAWLRYYADLQIAPQLIQDDEVARVEVVRRPLGVVAAIASWNYPVLIASWKLAPALRAGNTVVLKPSPYTPLATRMLCEEIDQFVPAGVVNLVTGGNDLGAWMTTHPVPRKVTFTGSTATGKRVAQAAASDLKRITLELGGNDAAIVLDDADPAAIAERLFTGAFRNSGQICTAIKRVYVAESIHDELVSALVERVSAAKVGDGIEPDTEIGPLNNVPQLERVEELVAEALAAGGTAATGGFRPDRPGYFFAPTVVTDVAEGVRLVDEEQFGPALPVMRFRDVDEAVRRANATTYGLCGSVWSSDAERASAVAARLECGTTWVNTHLAVGPHQPFGGHKWSGIGVENGVAGLESFTDIQTQYRAR